MMTMLTIMIMLLPMMMPMNDDAADDDDDDDDGDGDGDDDDDYDSDAHDEDDDDDDDDDDDYSDDDAAHYITADDRRLNEQIHEALNRGCSAPGDYSLLMMLEGRNVRKGLPEEQIAGFAQYQFSEKNAKKSSGDSSEISDNNRLCVICQYDFKEGDNVLLLPCLHRYHCECITTWLKEKRKCPVCNIYV